MGCRERQDATAVSAWQGRVRVDWSETVLDATLSCPDCGALTHYHGITPDLLVQCELCGAWYAAYDAGWMGDGVFGISSGRVLWGHIRTQWMLEQAVAELERLAPGRDHRAELREACEVVLRDPSELCPHLRPRGSCPVCRDAARVESLEEDNQRLRAERCCESCAITASARLLSRENVEERRDRLQKQRIAEDASWLAEEMTARLREVEEELADLRAGRLSSETNPAPFTPGSWPPFGTGDPERDMWVRPNPELVEANDIFAYALTVDGYAYADSMLGWHLPKQALKLKKIWHGRRKAPMSFVELRLLLFWEQRSAHHLGQGGELTLYSGGAAKGIELKHGPSERDVQHLRDLNRAICEAWRREWPERDVAEDGRGGWGRQRA